MYDYIRDPDAIYRKSFATVQAEVDLTHMDADIGTLITRIVHSCGMPEIVPDMAFHPDIARACREALNKGCPVLVDCEMVSHGIIRRFLPADNPVICTLNDPGTPALAKEIGNTRSAAAVEYWRPHLAGAIIVIGNAPTALFHLLELLQEGAPKPAAILGFPVGFVGAAESKEALATFDRDLPFITLHGRKGGSAMAAAALNAAATLTRKDPA
ncbi:precorrin-8X methylmutase [Sneathiella chinensis]|uniref:Precorrin-8X methylmutase n=1 Tax=Sneathiella chinensis TaxID=349750 RepID=A0ABQ5U441_9PROT|nr:precorrin-8X methylmutase [Sneathiella chinensis]GLQ06171.1 precorrin-8X methylmutase [Sneathiella chinensis]